MSYLATINTTPGVPEGMRIVQDNRGGGQGEFLLEKDQEDLVVSHQRGFFFVEEPQQLHYFELENIEANKPMWTSETDEGQVPGPVVFQGRDKCLAELAKRRKTLQAEQAILQRLGVVSVWDLKFHGVGWVEGPALSNCHHGPIHKVEAEEYFLLDQATRDRAYGFLPRY